MNRAFSHSRTTGFTLVEMLVSMVLLVLLVLILVTITDSTRKTWASTNAKIEEFRGAREGFETITRRLSDATLNTYWDYHYDAQGVIDKYLRQSELRFLGGPGIAQIDASKRPTHAVFFQAPLGFATSTGAANLPQLLNTWGYFIEFSDDSAISPPFLAALANSPPPHTRFRLMELMEPSENLSVYKYTSGFDSSSPPKAKNDLYTGTDWFTNSLLPPPANSPNATDNRLYRPVADNVVALVLLPKLTPGDQSAGGFNDASLAPDYRYDTTAERSNKKINPKNQLPPVVQVTMVAVSESSYLRIHPDTRTPPSMPSLYTNSPFTSASAYKDDLQELTKALDKEKLTYRIFTTNVSIKSAKWSTD